MKYLGIILAIALLATCSTIGICGSTAACVEVYRPGFPTAHYRGVTVLSPFDSAVLVFLTRAGAVITVDGLWVMEGHTWKELP